MSKIQGDSALVVPTYDHWIQETKAFGRPRSPELKKLDEAIRNFHTPGNMVTKRKAVSDALEAWKKAKGPGWSSSVRNKTKAVEKLDAALGHVIKFRILDEREMRALREVEASERMLIDTMFRTHRFVVKGSTVSGTLKDVTGAMKAAKDAAEKIKSGTGAVAQPSASAVKAAAQPLAPATKTALEQMLKNLFDTQNIAEVMSALGPLYTDFFAAVTPFLGLCKSGADAAKGWGQVAHRAWQKHKVSESREAFRPGNPGAAFDAVKRLLQREINELSTQATISTVSFTVDVVLNATTLGASNIAGPVKGAAESLAKLFHKIYLFARDYKEMKKANTLLEGEELDMRLFETCPLLGAYFLAFAPTSAIINFALRDFGKLNWKFEVEMLQKQAELAISKARDYVKASRYELPGLGYDFSKGERKAMAKDVAGATKNLAGMR